MLITRAATFAEVYDSFQWRLPQRYNIAWDVCDRHAESGRTAMIHHKADGQVRTYSFGEIQRLANQFANLLTGLGLSPGARVMLFLPQHPLPPSPTSPAGRRAWCRCRPPSCSASTAWNTD